MFSNVLAWIRFFRLPAVLTVPGDVWVGAAVAGRSAHGREVGAVCLAYLFGMAFNDWWDRKKDLEHRPERPIPSGAVSASWGGVACVFLLVGSIIMLPEISTVVLLVTIVAYTTLKSQLPLVGAVLMGLCRFQSVWIGAGADQAESMLEWTVPLCAGVLIFLLTWLAQLEGTERKATIRSIFFACGLIVAAIAGMWMGGKQGPTSWALLGTVAGVAIANHAAIEQKKVLPPSCIGIYLSMWIPLQAIWVLGAEQAAEGAFLIAAAIALPWLQQKISIS